MRGYTMKERDELLVRVAELYYQQNLSQNEVAKIIGVSRPLVSRLLIEARNTGIVEIKIHTKIKKNGDLSLKLRNTFNLKEAIVVEGNPDIIKLHELGIHNVIASSGTALSKEQINQMKRYTEDIVL